MANFMCIQRLGWSRKVQVANRMKSKNPQLPQRIAFTVIELLVMIVTIAMLLFLLISGVPKVREQARTKHCVNNLKQIGMAFRLWGIYSDDRGPNQLPSDAGGSMESI